METSLWKGHTSQWVHFWYYLFCVLLAVAALVGIPFTAGLSAIGLVLPFGMWMVRWWMTRTTSYELTTQRLKISSGILSRESNHTAGIIAPVSTTSMTMVRPP